jgi:ferredoxin
MPKVFFVNENKEIEVPAGANLRTEAKKAGINVYRGLAKFLNCFGHGTCGTCKVLVKKGMENLSQPGRMERFTLWRMLSSIGREDEMRLACQCQVNGDCTVETKPGLQVSPEKDAKGKFFWETPYPNK